jgi:DNA polymerase
VRLNEKEMALKEIYQQVQVCDECELYRTRKNVVFGEGTAEARLLFVGEGPGFEEDLQGRPFVGRAGQLLNKIIQAMGLDRKEVYIANIVKCHPLLDPNHPEKRGNDRPPKSEEIFSCLPYLQAQIKIIQPKVICALGKVAGSTLLKVEKSLGELRGKLHSYSHPELTEKIKLIVTYHPAALLRNPRLKTSTWQDMQMVIKEL